MTIQPTLNEPKIHHCSLSRCFPTKKNYCGRTGRSTNTGPNGPKGRHPKWSSKSHRFAATGWRRSPAVASAGPNTDAPRGRTEPEPGRKSDGPFRRSGVRVGVPHKEGNSTQGRPGPGPRSPTRSNCYMLKVPKPSQNGLGPFLSPPGKDLEKTAAGSPTKTNQRCARRGPNRQRTIPPQLRLHAEVDDLLEHVLAACPPEPFLTDFTPCPCPPGMTWLPVLARSPIRPDLTSQSSPCQPSLSQGTDEEEEEVQEH